MTRAETPIAQIHSIAHQDGERALLAAVLRLAVTDAQGGDTDAASWLKSTTCAALLSFLIPDTSGMSPEQLQAQLLRHLPAWMRATHDRSHAA